ncbi:hypothetical protein [Devosia sp. 1635]|uniref:hypothetical protein n=1 Tax=Devosia sp. 1635 TaxID=2726066 RepID=UPI0015664C5D|nr:hypothetical protein [Devosia sp. 1635]
MPNLSLRRLLFIDAATCTAMALLLLTGSGPLSRLTAIPSSFLFYAGMLLLSVAIFMAITARRQYPANWATNFIILGNIAWVVASIALPFAGLFTPSALGWTFLLVQAAIVLVLALLERRAAAEIPVIAA